VKEGDRVVGYLPCTPEATVAFLAANALGAVWSSCSPDFGTAAVVDRFAQIEPVVLITVDSYRYGGKRFDKSETVKSLIEALPSLQGVVLISENETPDNEQKIIVNWKDIAFGWKQAGVRAAPFSHPIGVVFFRYDRVAKGHCSFTW
jgi:acetoacetyl-CoA synthetase